MNHCIHGTPLAVYCPACEFDCCTLEEWLDFLPSARFAPDCNVDFALITTLAAN